MVKNPVTINGLAVPLSWEQCSTSLYRKFRKLCISNEQTSVAYFVSALTGVEPDEIADEQCKQLAPFLQYIFEAPQPEQINSLHINGQHVTFFDDMKEEPAGVYWNCIEMITRTNTELIDMATDLVSYGIQHTMNNHVYDERQIKALVPIIDSLPVTEVLFAAGFFLNRHLQSESSKRIGSRQSRSLRKRQQGLMSLISSERLTRCLPQRRVITVPYSRRGKCHTMMSSACSCTTVSSPTIRRNTGK